MVSFLNAISAGYIVLIVFGSIAVVLLALLFGFVPMKSWLTGLFSGAYISIFKLSSLRLRKIKPKRIVDAFIMAKRGKLKLSFADVEAFVLAGGDIDRALSAMMFAKDSGLDVNFETVKALEFEGRDSLKTIAESVNPNVSIISSISGIAQDNIELIVEARMGTKLNVANCIGGLDIESLKARIQKLIITNIGKSASHKQVLMHPDRLLAGIDEKIDDGCEYNLVSLEISRVDLGRDVGAEMAAKSAQREIAMAQVEAEKKKNDAMIEEQQMKARVEQMKAEVLEAEAELPRALSDAVKEGRFSVMDYYKLMNLQADTAMRRAIMSKDDEPGGDDE